jgi:hypothetical protein
MLFLNLKLKQTSGIMRLKHPQHSTKTKCSFCGKRSKSDDGNHLLPVSQELTYWHFLFPIYCCDECVRDGELTYLIEIMETVRLLENFHVWIHFDDHLIVNPSDAYVPFIGPSGNLQFLCMNKKCSMIIQHCSTERSLFHESKIHGCVINPQTGKFEIASVSIAKIILGDNLLKQILRQECACSYIRSLGEFNSEQIKNSFSFLSLVLENPDFRICDAIQNPSPETYVGPRIHNFSIENPNSIMKLFSLLVSGTHSNDAIKAFLNGEMKEGFLKFITESMISMTAFMTQTGFQENFPELKEAPVIPEFLTRNYGEAHFSFTHQDIICQNFRNLLKLFRKILRYFYLVDASSRSIDLFQYCCFLYATLHGGNREIHHRMIRNSISLKSSSQYFEYLERYVMSKSLFCIEIFENVPTFKTELDKCAICLSDDSASIIGRCPQHNICCLGCFQRVVQIQKSCPSCRSPDFLP